MNPVFKDSHTERFSKNFDITETDVSIKEIEQFQQFHSQLSHQTPLPLKRNRYVKVPCTQEAGLKPQCSR